MEIEMSFTKNNFWTPVDSVSGFALTQAISSAVNLSTEVDIPDECGLRLLSFEKSRPLADLH
jgi:hypothetical protein